VSACDSYLGLGGTHLEPSFAMMGHLVLQQLKVDQTKTVPAVVYNVLGPRAALHVDQDVGHGALELNSHDGRKVAGSVHVGEVVGWESLPWRVGDGSDVFLVSWVLSLARHPDHLRENLFSFVE